MDLTSAHSHVLFLLYIFSWCSLYSPCWFQCYCPEGVIGPFLSHSSPSLQRSSSQLQQNAGFWWLSAREISLIRQEIWMNWHAHHSAQVYSAALKSMGCSSSLSGPAEGKAGHSIGDYGNFSVLPWPAIPDMMPQTDTAMLHSVLCLKYSTYNIST